MLTSVGRVRQLLGLDGQHEVRGHLFRCPVLILDNAGGAGRPSGQDHSGQDQG